MQKIHQIFHSLAPICLSGSSLAFHLYTHCPPVILNLETMPWPPLCLAVHLPLPLRGAICLPFCTLHILLTFKMMFLGLFLQGAFHDFQV